MKKNRALLVCMIGLAILFMAFKSEHKPQNPSEEVKFINIREVHNTSFKEGERAVYRVHYGFLTAGTAEFQLDNKLSKYNNRDCYRAHGYVKTSSGFEWFYKVRSEFHTYMDKTAIVPWYYTRKSQEGSYHMTDTVAFDHSQKMIKGKKGNFKMEEYTQDVMSAFYYARCLNLKNVANGTVFRIHTFMDDNIYNLGLTVIKRETINTEFGKVRCIKIAPYMVSGRVFKDKDQMYLWVSDDDNYLPIHVESPVIVGSIQCDLIKYENLKNPFTALVK